MNLDISFVNKDALAFVEMGDAEFTQLLDELKTLPTSVETANVVYEVIRARTSLEEEVSAGHFILSAFSTIADRGEKTVAQIIDELLDEAGDMGFRLDLLKSRLEEFVKLQNVARSIKAAILISAQEKILTSTRVLFDLRPIPYESASDSAMLALITLKLEYRENGEQASTYLSLDKEDVAKLISQLESTQREINSYSASLSSSNVHIIE